MSDLQLAHQKIAELEANVELLKRQLDALARVVQKGMTNEAS